MSATPRQGTRQLFKDVTQLRSPVLAQYAGSEAQRTNRPPERTDPWAWIALDSDIEAVNGHTRLHSHLRDRSYFRSLVDHLPFLVLRAGAAVRVAPPTGASLFGLEALTLGSSRVS